MTLNSNGTRQLNLSKNVGLYEISSKLINHFFLLTSLIHEYRWNPGHADFNTTFPPAVRTVLDVDKPHVRLHLKAFYTKYFTARGVSRRSPDTSLVPHSNLISFTSSCPSWTSDMPSLQKFLVASRMLQNLDLTPSTYGVCINLYQSLCCSV